MNKKYQAKNHNHQTRSGVSPSAGVDLLHGRSFQLGRGQFWVNGVTGQTCCFFCNSIIPIIPNRSGFANGHEWFYHDNPTIFQPMFFQGQPIDLSSKLFNILYRFPYNPIHTHFQRFLGVAVLPLAAQEFHWLEFYAGTANCTAAMQRTGFTCGKFDILYCPKQKQGSRKTNWHDIMTPSGFAQLSWF